MNKITFLNKLRKLIKPQRGQSLVEFAMLVPILLVLFMGIFDFGWVLHQQIQMDNATRLGARRGAVGETTADIIVMMKDTMSFTVPDDEITIDVIDPNGDSVGDNTNRTPDNYIYVQINRPTVNLLTPLGNFIEGLTTISLHSEAEFLIE